jgi:hypothetical protein
MKKNYLITVVSPTTEKERGHVTKAYYDQDSDMFHALCRALEHSGREDIEVTVKLMQVV